MTSTGHSYFVYRHIRPDKNEPFYVGLGKTNIRATAIQYQFPRAYLFRGRNTVWNRVFTKNNGLIEVDILSENLSRDEAIKKEIEFISLYGRKNNKSGILVNLSDGGEGNFGYVASEETRKKISAIHKGKKMSPESIAKMRLRRHTQEWKEENSKRMKGHQTPDHVKEKISKTKLGNTIWLGRKHSPETIEKMRQWHTGKKVSDETKAKISKGHIGKKLSEDHKKKLALSNIGSKRNLGRKLTQEHKAKISKSLIGNTYNRGKKRTDEQRARISAANRKRYSKQ